MVPVIEALKSDAFFEVKVCVTAQHRQMLDQVLELFDIVPDFDLNLMKDGQGLADITVSVVSGMMQVLEAWTPHLVLVHGDTTTTFAASLAAFYRKIPVGHVEAGLRTGNIYAPWPEEMNRRLTSALTTVHFAPTAQAAANLVGEGILPQSIIVTGNTVIDSLLKVVAKIRDNPDLECKLSGLFPWRDESLKLILVTGHRRENFGAGFESICTALMTLGSRPDVQIVYPVHLNPNVQKPVSRLLGNVPAIHLIAPLDYLPFVYLMSKSYIIITDSGGVQEEAPSLGKPVLVLREITERPEAVEAGTVRLVGTESQAIITAAGELLDNPLAYGLMSKLHNPYGDGKAARRIADYLISDVLPTC